MLKENLAANVKRLRLKKKLTQTALAEKVGITTSYVSEIERGNKEPTLTVIERMGTSLGVRPVSLLEKP